MSMYTSKDHVFAVCAYKESEFLEECIQSLQQQTIKTEIIMVTSTPGKYISGLAEKYHIALYINEGESGIAQDWNFACAAAKKSLVTIAHQDDIYEPNYAETVLKAANESSHPLVIFTDYGELRNDEKVDENRLLRVKRMLLRPLKRKCLQESIFVRRRILSVGNAISCPAVTLCRDNLPDVIFPTGCRSNVDWLAWEAISRMKGAFMYCPSIGMYHRIHENSTTSEVLSENGREKEDLEVLEKFWPSLIAHFIERFYKKAENSNNVV